MVHPETQEQPFFLQASYTWKHVLGNYEGYYAEGDPASNLPGSQVFQCAALTQRAAGNLLQDIRHSFLLNASHTFGSSGFSARLGANWQGGANKSCYSQDPVPADAASSAGEHAYYCGGVAVTRGSLGRLPNWWLLNANAAWAYSWGPSPCAWNSVCPISSIVTGSSGLIRTMVTMMGRPRFASCATGAECARRRVRPTSSSATTGTGPRPAIARCG
ncbi:hypothetical protein [Xanthomonas theicola]